MQRPGNLRWLVGALAAVIVFGAITVEYIDIHGRHPLTNADLVERVYR